MGLGAAVDVCELRTWRCRRVPWACSGALRPRRRALPPPGSLDGGSGDSDKGWRGWDAETLEKKPARRGRAPGASCGPRGAWLPLFLAGAWLSGNRREFEAVHPVGKNNFLRYPLGHTRIFAGLRCRGFVWLMPPGQEVKITCGPLGGIEPGSCF